MADRECPLCEGSGLKELSDLDILTGERKTRKCGWCNGTGRVAAQGNDDAD